jgi:hypothetical protein
MSNLEEFLKTNKINLNKLEPFESGNTCFECDEFIEKGFIDNTTMQIFWICSKGHHSKVDI